MIQQNAEKLIYHRRSFVYLRLGDLNCSVNLIIDSLFYRARKHNI